MHWFLTNLWQILSYLIYLQLIMQAYSILNIYYTTVATNWRRAIMPSARSWHRCCLVVTNASVCWRLYAKISFYVKRTSCNVALQFCILCTHLPHSFPCILFSQPFPLPLPSPNYRKQTWSHFIPFQILWLPYPFSHLSITILYHIFIPFSILPLSSFPLPPFSPPHESFPLNSPSIAGRRKTELL
jgi:hypothetical protein